VWLNLRCMSPELAELFAQREHYPLGYLTTPFQLLTLHCVEWDMKMKHEMRERMDLKGDRMRPTWRYCPSIRLLILSKHTRNSRHDIRHTGRDSNWIPLTWAIWYKTSWTLNLFFLLRVSENRALRRIFVSKREEVAGGWRRLHKWWASWFVHYTKYY
jgi:hypothetical protein